MSPIDRLTCQEVFERLDDYLDRELSAAEVERVQAHLETCAICAAEYAFEGRVIEQVREKLRRIEVPGSVVENVRRALRLGSTARD